MEVVTGQQQLHDIEAMPVDASTEHKRKLGMSKLDAVILQAKAGQDPWEYQQQPKRRNQADELAEAVHDPDVAAMGAWLEQNRMRLLAAGFIVAQGGSWVLIKGSLLSMHTPAVLTFLHLLAAALTQLLLVANGLLPAAHLSATAAKGALVPAASSALQLLLVMCVLEHASVILLLCWIIVMPLLLSLTRVAHVAKRRWLLLPPAAHLPWLTAAVAGLGLEMLSDHTAHSFVALLLLLALAVVSGLDLVWHQVKQDATLGHSIMEPDFLFHARQLADLEDSLSPSSRALLCASLPSLPVLLLGLISLEAKDLVDHEPSVPTLEVMLLSCLAFAAVHCVQVMLAVHGPPTQRQLQLMKCGAACMAVVFELLERGMPGSNSLWRCAAVVLCVGGSCGCHMMSLEGWL